MIPIVADDLRGGALTPGQLGVEAKAPVQLIYVVDIDRFTHTRGFQERGLQDPEVQMSYYYVDTGLIAGNVYLFAAAEGLAAWFHNCHRTDLARRLGLRPEQRVFLLNRWDILKKSGGILWVGSCRQARTITRSRLCSDRSNTHNYRERLAQPRRRLNGV